MANKEQKLVEFLGFIVWDGCSELGESETESGILHIV